jgi:hypothetical protein
MDGIWCVVNGKYKYVYIYIYIPPVVSREENLFIDRTMLICIVENDYVRVGL